MNIISGVIIQANNQVEMIIGTKPGEEIDTHLYLSFCINFSGNQLLVSTFSDFSKINACVIRISLYSYSLWS